MVEVDSYKKIADFKLQGETDFEAILKEYGPDVYSLLNEIIDAYIDIEDDDKTILASWLMAAAFKDGFLTMPILYINASKGSGKSRLLSLINAILPMSIKILDATESVIFRLAKARRCIILDEAEKDKISNREKVNLTELLNSCYKRGGVVVRVEKNKGGHYEPVEYEVFNPVVLANTFGLSNIIEDRCISIIMKKTTRQDIIRTPEYFQNDVLIGAVRAWFAQVSEGVGYFLLHTYTNNILEKYLYNNKYNNHILPSLSITSDEIKNFFLKSEGLNVDGRSFELWLPLLEITFTFDTPNLHLVDKLILIAQERSQERVQDNAEFDRDTNTAVMLYAYINTLASPDFYPKEFRDWYMDQEGITKSGLRRHWMTPEWVGHFLRRIKSIKSKRKTNKGYFYGISKARLTDYLEARGALDAAEERKQVGEVKPPQKTITTPELPNGNALKPNIEMPTGKDWDALKTGLKTGLILGHEFENAPQAFREALMGMAHAGIIYEPKPGDWRYVEATQEAT
jgi:hypothetical protein